jgi:hypothetical protein
MDKYTFLQLARCLSLYILKTLEVTNNLVINVNLRRDDRASYLLVKVGAAPHVARFWRIHLWAVCAKKPADLSICNVLLDSAWCSDNDSVMGETNSNSIPSHRTLRETLTDQEELHRK